MDALLPIIIQAVTGIIAGEAVGAAFKQAAMSHVAKIISGAVGGVGGGAILGGLLGDPATAGAMGGMLGDAVGGLLGGGVLTAIVGAIMGGMNKRSA